MSRKRHFAAGVGALLLAALSACGSSDGSSGAQDQSSTKNLQMGTANPGGGYFTMGSEYAQILEDNVDGLQVSAIETGGSIENLVKIGRGELQLGLSQASSAVQVIEGEGEFEGANVDNAGLLGCLEPYALHVMTLQGTDIDSISDLTGKRVAIGAPGSANQQASRALLGAYGISSDDYNALEEASDDARSKLQDGNVDVIIDMQTIPFPGLQELQASTREAKLLPIEEEPLKQLQDSTVFAEFTIPADSYDFQQEPLQTVSDWSCFFASTDEVSPDIGYEITKIIYENASELTLPAKDRISVDNALLARSGLPLHPGAEEYFKEAGALE